MKEWERTFKVTAASMCFTGGGMESEFQGLLSLPATPRLELILSLVIPGTFHQFYQGVS